MSSSPIYNKIGVGYNTTRRADPYIASRMLVHLQPEKEGVYLDLGCGTGNYLKVMSDQGYKFYGVEPSDTMLQVAKQNCPDVAFVQASAETLPLENEFFDGATIMFTLHHWADWQQGLNELGRVLKSGAHAVFLTFTPQQLLNYWLYHYFPEMMKKSAQVVPEYDEMERMLRTAGYDNIEAEPYFVHDDLQDHFLYSNKRRPEQYLKGEVRAGASSFTAFSTPEEVASGLEQLEADIISGKINEIMAKYENDLGDYLFIKAVKQ